MKLLLLFIFVIVVNVPGCDDVAFVDDDKYLTCPYPSSDSTVAPCEGYDASNAPSLGGTLVWCVFTTSRTQYCINNLNYTNTHLPESPVLPMNISDSGILYISRVNLDLRGKNGSTVNCSVFNSQGILCGASTLEIVIYTEGKSVTYT